MAKKKCYVCGKIFKESELNKVVTHWICNNCVEDYKKTLEYHREKFIDDVWQLYDEKPTFLQLEAQIKDFVINHGFTYQGLDYALHWYLKTHEWNQEYLLYQAFPKAYYDAQKYYLQQKQHKQLLKQHKQYDKAEVVKATNKSMKPPLPLE